MSSAHERGPRAGPERAPSGPAALLERGEGVAARAAGGPGGASHLRALVRVVPVAALTLATGPFLILVRPLGWIAPTGWERLHNLALRTWARSMAWVLGMRLVVEGSAPRPPFLLAANHLSYLDIIALWTRAEGDFLAKSEIAGWPLFGWLTRSAGTLFVDRTRAADLPRVIALVQGVLARRRGVIFFPEGTSSEGAGVLPFRPSLFEAAIATGHPVHCASITYATPSGAPPAREAVCWWGDMDFLGHLYRLMMLPGFEARVVFEPEPARGQSRKELARHAQALVARHFVPVTGNPGARIR